MRIKKRKKTWIYVVTALLLCAIVGGCVYAFVGTDNKDNMKKISPTFSLGGLDANGKYVETKESIYTKDAFECKGLTVTPEFESQVTYQIFFYDSTGEFISKTEKLEKVYKDEVDIVVTHARIVITPNEDEDGNAVTMNVFNKSKYAKQITITVNKEQKQAVLVFDRIELTDDSMFTLKEGLYFDVDGSEHEHSDYNGYVFVASKKCSFYIDLTDVGDFMYVIVKTDGSVVRYKVSDSNFVFGKENTFDLGVGDKVLIAINKNINVNGVEFYLGQTVLK